MSLSFVQYLDLHHPFREFCSNSADMQWMDKLPTATLGSERGTATRSVWKIAYDVFIMSTRKGVGECSGKGGVGHVGQLSTAQ